MKKNQQFFLLLFKFVQLHKEWIDMGSEFGLGVNPKRVLCHFHSILLNI